MGNRKSRSKAAPKKREKTKVLYGVFESVTDLENAYLIFKFDSAADRKGNPIELRKPICCIKRSDLVLREMDIFVVGSKLYLIGGYYDNSLPYREYSRSAYKVDLNIFNSSGKEEGKTPINVTHIPPMKSPKPISWVLGPVNDTKFYIISESLDDGCSFEVLDTSTDEWESLPKPDIDKLGDFLSESYGLSRYDLKYVLSIISSAVCGSTIYLSTQVALFVFCTETVIWKTFWNPHRCTFDCYNPRPKPTYLPFLGPADPLLQKKHIFLTTSFEECTPPLVYKLTPGLQLEMENIGQGDIFEDPGFQIENIGQGNIFEDPGFQLENIGQGHIFEDQGELLEGFEKHLVPRPKIVGCNFSACAFHYNYDPRIVIVRIGGPPDKPFSKKNFVIDVCNVSLIEGDKVKIESTVTYKHCSNVVMIPKCFFVVA